MTTSSHSPECRRLMIDYCACMLTPRVTAGRSPQADTPLTQRCRTTPGPSWPKPCDCLASFRKKATDAGNPATSTPISPHKATDAGNPAPSTPISPHKATDAGSPRTSTPTSPPKATGSGDPGQLGHRLSAHAREPGPPRPPSLRTKPQIRGNQA